MKPWDIYTWNFPHGKHPAVIIGPEPRCDNPDLEYVNVLACQSKRALRPARIIETILDEADGLDWPTLCRCDIIYLAPKAELTARRGRVCLERQKDMGARIIRLFGLLRG